MSFQANEQTVTSVAEFVDALRADAPGYNIDLEAEDLRLLGAFYDIVMAWNKRLHLVAPCSPVEFANRHVLESLLALPYITRGAHVADLGSGAGLPIIPCSIVRPDLHATLFESSPKKAVFLREALRRVERHRRGVVIAERFETASTPKADFITCRALDRLPKMFPKIMAWAPVRSTFLLFGGHALREQIEALQIIYHITHIPNSEGRFIFVVKRDA